MEGCRHAFPSANDYSFEAEPTTAWEQATVRGDVTESWTRFKGTKLIGAGEGIQITPICPRMSMVFHSLLGEWTCHLDCHDLESVTRLCDAVWLFRLSVT